MAALPAGTCTVWAQQVHGSGVAVVERAPRARIEVAGCDALLTRMPGVALVVRTADCLPLFVCDAARLVIGLAHVGWRGLVAGLPLHLVATLRHAFQSRPRDLRVAVGPAIRTCCYEVGPEFAELLGPFVETRQGRRMCDLVGATVAQLRQGGVLPGRVLDSGQCTACDTPRWHSYRRERLSVGRLTSVIVARP